MPQAKLDAFPPKLVALSSFAKALSHPARIMILQFLSSRGSTPAMEIVDELPLSQPACSRHLAELHKVGLLKSRSKGNQIFYRLENRSLERFCQTMSKTLHP